MFRVFTSVGFSVTCIFDVNRMKLTKVNKLFFLLKGVKTNYNLDHPNYNKCYKVSAISISNVYIVKSVEEISSPRDFVNEMRVTGDGSLQR